MFPSGIIYNYKRSAPHGSVNLHATLPIKIGYNLARGIGAGLIGFVIIALLFTFGPLVKEEVKYDFYKPSQVDITNAANTNAIQEEAKKFGVNSYFSIVIPKIDAKANIVANVDTANETEYDKALLEGVAHAKGTYFPGQGKNIFLFAHSTNSPFNVARYNAVFYLLDKMSVGDEIIVYFADKRYVYKVTNTKIVGPTDTSYLDGKGLAGNAPTEILILQTCYPPGTSWNRLLVLAKPV
jgi:LPXTG-site transpeptidase (sortase) family protein